MPARPKQAHAHSALKRATTSIAIVVIVLGIGTLGFHYIENYSYIYSFYYTSMLATGEGPSGVPVTVLGKLFSSFMAFLGVGTVVISLMYLFGPFFVDLFRLGEREFEKEEKELGIKINKYKK